MKSILVTALVVPTPALAVQAFAAADDAIKQVFAQLDRCISNGDTKCVGDVFVDDATFASPTSGPKIIKGKAEIVKLIEKSLAGAKGPKQTRTVTNVRMLGEELALVDAAVAIADPAAKADGDASQERYHDVVLMVLKDGKWLSQDHRSYVVGFQELPKTVPEPEATKEPRAPEEKEPSSPAEKEPAPPAKE